MKKENCRQPQRLVAAILVPNGIWGLQISAPHFVLPQKRCPVKGKWFHHLNEICIAFFSFLAVQWSKKTREKNVSFRFYLSQKLRILPVNKINTSIRFSVLPFTPLTLSLAPEQLIAAPQHNVRSLTVFTFWMMDGNMNENKSPALTVWKLEIKLTNHSACLFFLSFVFFLFCSLQKRMCFKSLCKWRIMRRRYKQRWILIRRRGIYKLFAIQMCMCQRICGAKLPKWVKKY